jgi:uncharacterized protein YjiS (DUF1127 family)
MTPIATDPRPDTRAHSGGRAKKPPRLPPQNVRTTTSNSPTRGTRDEQRYADGEKGQSLLTAIGHTPRILMVIMKVRSLWRLVVSPLQTWSERASARQALWYVDDHILSDIGVTRDDIARRARNFFLGV